MIVMDVDGIEEVEAASELLGENMSLHDASRVTSPLSSPSCSLLHHDLEAHVQYRVRPKAINV